MERMKELLGVYPGADELECPETFPGKCLPKLVLDHEYVSFAPQC